MKIFGKNKSYLGINKDLKPVFEFEKITGNFFKFYFETTWSINDHDVISVKVRSVRIGE